jgi:hypothetical protein
MKTSIVAAQAYIATHGAPQLARGTANPEVKSIWTKLLKLEPMAAGSNGNGNGHKGQYLVVEKTDEDDLRSVRNRVNAGLRRYQRRLSPRTFAVRMRLREDENHLLIWREMLAADAPVVADAPVPVERTEQPTNAPAVTAGARSRASARSHQAA